MLLTRTSLYALRAIAVLANLPAGESLRSADLARLAEVPPPYLSKVMRKLVTAGLVTGRRGHDGGFCLARGARRVRVADVLAAVDDYPLAESCAFGWNECSAARPCPLHDLWSEAKARFSQWAEGTTLDGVGALDSIGGEGLPARRSRRRPKQR